METPMDAAVAPPAPRSAEVTEILSTARQYDEAAIGALEEHVRKQVSDGTYDAAANKSLVKLCVAPARFSAVAGELRAQVPVHAAAVQR